MENIKKIVSKLFLYKEPKNRYNFSLSKEQIDIDIDNRINENYSTDNKSTNIYTSLNVNIEYLKSKLNLSLNSDIIIRSFNISFKEKEYKSCLLFIDGMVDSNIINNFVLRPLMENTSKTSVKPKPVAIANNISVKKVKKISLESYLYNHLLPQNNIKKINTFNRLISGITSGECILLIDTLDVRFYFRCKRIWNKKYLFSSKRNSCKRTPGSICRKNKDKYFYA